MKELDQYKDMINSLMARQKNDEEIRKKLEENKKIKGLCENQESKEMNFSEIKNCNEEMKNFVIKIKEKIENFINEKYDIYELIGYKEY